MGATTFFVSFSFVSYFIWNWTHLSVPEALSFPYIFVDVNARYSISQNIDLILICGSTIYALFTDISTLYLLKFAFAVRIKDRLIQVFYLCVEFSIYSHKHSHWLTWVYFLVIYGYYFLTHLLFKMRKHYWGFL